MIDLLRPVARMFWFVRAEGARSRDPRDLLDYAHATRTPARLGGTVAEGFRAAVGDNVFRDSLLVTGSHYVVGELLAALRVPV